MSVSVCVEGAEVSACVCVCVLSLCVCVFACVWGIIMVGGCVYLCVAWVPLGVCVGVLCAASVSGTGVGGGLLPVCVLSLCVCVWVFMCLCGCHGSQAAVAPAISPRVSGNTPSGSRMGATASRVVIQLISIAKQPPQPPSSKPAWP